MMCRLLLCLVSICFFSSFSQAEKYYAVLSGQSSNTIGEQDWNKPLFIKSYSIDIASNGSVDACKRQVKDQFEDEVKKIYNVKSGLRIKIVHFGSKQEAAKRKFSEILNSSINNSSIIHSLENGHCDCAFSSSYAPSYSSGSNTEKRQSYGWSVFVMYMYDQHHPLGVSYVSTTSDIGWYGALKMNFHIFNGTNGNRIDNSGSVSSSSLVPSDDKLLFTGNRSEGSLSAHGGITVMTFYKFWLYGGLGLGIFPNYEEYDSYDEDGDYLTTDWYKNTDESRLSLLPQAGFYWQWGESVLVSSGVYLKQGDLVGQFGFGVTF